MFIILQIWELISIMEKAKNLHTDIELKRLTDEKDYYFFGYYDLPAFSQNEKYHLCHRVGFWDRLPEKDDVAELGLIDLNTDEFKVVTETTAWNFQQGAMLQWNPVKPDEEIIFNVREGNEYRGIIKNINNGKEKVLDLPVANVDPRGKFALSINFNRLFDFRPGYGYTGFEDEYIDKNHSEDDGVYLIDMETGKVRLIISLAKIWEVTGSSFNNDKKILINHITFNTDSSRFVFLVRNFPEPDDKRWQTTILTAATDGSDIYILSDYSYASHYHWRDKNHIVFHSRGKEVSEEGDNLYLLKDKSREGEIIDQEFFTADGHCSYSPDRNWLLYDSYPDQENYRHLYLYNLQKGEGYLLGSFFSYPEISGDIRCDLHPRWSPSGKAISFDSIHEGQRHLYYVELAKLKGKIN